MAVLTTPLDRGQFDGTGSDEAWDRDAVGLLAAAALTHGTGAFVRPGVIPANGNPGGFVATSGMSGTLKAFTCVGPASDAAKGAFYLHLPADFTFTLNNPHASLDRIDVIAVVVQDNGDGTTTASADVLTGTPAGSPVEAADPAGADFVLRLAAITIPHTGGTGTLGAIADRRQWTAGAGGVVAIPGAIATPSLASALPPGAPVFDSASGVNRIAIRDSSTGLIDLDPRPQVKRFSLFRSAVPGSGNDAITPARGFKLTFTYDSTNSTPTVPSTTQSNSDTELIIGVAGWYDIGATAQFHANTNATGSIELHTHATGTDAVTWFQEGGVGAPSGYDRMSYRATNLKLATGSHVRLVVNRPAGSSGDINGSFTLTLLRAV